MDFLDVVVACLAGDPGVPGRLSDSFPFVKRAEKEPRGHWWTADYEWHDVGAIAIFALLAYGSIALGAYRAYDRHEAAALILLVVEVLLLTVIAVRFLHETTTVRDRVRRRLKSPPAF